MGNVVQCCYSLSNYLKCIETPAQGGEESSPLLSSEGSEYDSLTLLDNLDDELFNISAGVTNTAMEQEHLLFPDIILSSHFAGDVTLVDPMVCLLVSEEEEEQARGDSLRIGRERSDRGRYFEAETQTEDETQIGMGVQTEPQAEVETQTEFLEDEAEESVMSAEANTQTSSEMILDFWEDRERLSQVGVQLQTEAEISPGVKGKNKAMTTLVPAEKSNFRTWFDVAPFTKSELTPNLERKKDRTTVDNKAKLGELKEMPIQEEPMTTLRKHTLKEVNTNGNQNKSDLQKKSTIMDLTPAQESTDIPWMKGRIFQTWEHVKEQEECTETESSSVMLIEHNINSVDENFAVLESENFLLTKHNISTETVENCDITEACADLTKKRNENNEQMAQGGVSDQDVSEIDDIIICKKAEFDLSGDERNETMLCTPP
ncbi:uncharacterized protein LOC117517213 [Thalassophryne amazonica]|uniref:uncharacterized protein LOC117517213 n=1 Tax=Thalassophryne amazonica TaxID=390379 RepID=UPI001470B26A|nr:uncharacterized protein LOC117517213 [Thalassophryne amazonica]